MFINIIKFILTMCIGFIIFCLVEIVELLFYIQERIA